MIDLCSWIKMNELAWNCKVLLELREVKKKKKKKTGFILVECVTQIPRDIGLLKRHATTLERRVQALQTDTVSVIVSIICCFQQFQR